MKQPLWIVNSSLGALLIGAFLFILFSRQRIPYRTPLEPETHVERPKHEEFKINIDKIYENDFFDTYQKEFAKPIEAVKEIPMPQPPKPQQTRVPEEPKIEFLDPLNITLKGIVILSSDDTKNRVIIQDNATAREMSYKVGNMVQDAQLIRILSNKAIFLRANGQQEVLYLREKDAEMDPAYAALTGWSQVIKRLDDYHHLINPNAFIERITNLAQLIDMLDLTTAYQKGVSVGCRIGTVRQNSLGAALGFNTGDIVTSIDGILATDTTNRFKIYKNIIARQHNTPITVELLRNGQPITLVYALEEFSILAKLEETNPAQELELEQKMKEKQLKALEQKKLLTPSVQDMRKRERQQMVSRGRAPAHYKQDQKA